MLTSSNSKKMRVENINIPNQESNTHEMRGQSLSDDIFIYRSFCRRVRRYDGRLMMSLNNWRHVKYFDSKTLLSTVYSCLVSSLHHMFRYFSREEWVEWTPPLSSAVHPRISQNTLWQMGLRRNTFGWSCAPTNPTNISTDQKTMS